MLNSIKSLEPVKAVDHSRILEENRFIWEY